MSMYVEVDDFGPGQVMVSVRTPAGAEVASVTIKNRNGVGPALTGLTGFDAPRGWVMQGGLKPNGGGGWTAKVQPR